MGTTHKLHMYRENGRKRKKVGERERGKERERGREREILRDQGQLLRV